jgi:hypothetical protein
LGEAVGSAGRVAAATSAMTQQHISG